MARIIPAKVLGWALAALLIAYVAGYFLLQFWVVGSIRGGMNAAAMDQFDRRMAVFSGLYSPLNKALVQTRWLKPDAIISESLNRQSSKGFPCMGLRLRELKLPDGKLATTAVDAVSFLRQQGVDLGKGEFAYFLPKTQTLFVSSTPANRSLCIFIFD